MQLDEAFPQVMFHVLGVELRDTVVITWGIILVLAIVGWIATRRLSDRPGALQAAAESIVEGMTDLIGRSTDHPPERFLPFIGTLGVFLFAANAISTVPALGAPTKDLSTTFALAVLVFFAVHYYAIRLVGVRRYLSTYVEPHWLLLPFNIIGEVTRTIALALRLFGNMLSGELVVAVLLLIAGLLVPVPLQMLGLLIGVIQAYVFTLLAMVYIAAALQVTRAGEPS